MPFHYKTFFAVCFLCVPTILMVPNIGFAQSQRSQNFVDQDQQVAENKGQPLFARHIAKWGSLQKVGGREYKFLLNPKLFSDGGKNDRKEKYEIIWEKVKAAAQEQGFKVKDRKKKPYKESKRTRAYFDTADFQLRKKGYIIRISTKLRKITWGIGINKNSGD